MQVFLCFLEINVCFTVEPFWVWHIWNYVALFSESSMFKKHQQQLIEATLWNITEKENPYTSQCFAAIEIEHDLIFSSKAQKRGEAFQKLLNLPHVLQRTPLQLWQWVFSLSLPSVSTHWQTVEVFLAVIGFDFRKSVMIVLFRHACFA